MRAETKKAFKELMNAVKDDLSNPETHEVRDLMPEYGCLEEDYFDSDKGCQEIYRFNRTEQEAIEIAQDELLNGFLYDRLDEFFTESRIRPLMIEFMRQVAKEICKC